MLLNKEDVWVFLRQRLDRLGLGFFQKLAEPGAFLHALNDFFSRCQDELIEPEDFEKYVQAAERAFLEKDGKLDPGERVLEEEEIQKKKELSRVFRNSRRLIERAGSSSLGSLIPEAVRILDREPEVCQAYRKQFRVVLVDEFQDTNYAQVELLRRLVAPPFNITAVGDDDQAIYRFRGASHGAFDMFGKVFPGHDTIFLNRNYRSTERVLHVADVVIKKNGTRYPGKPELIPEREQGCPIYLPTSPDYVSEANWVAEEIQRLFDGGTLYGDIAVLYRAHNYRDRLGGGISAPGHTIRYSWPFGSFHRDYSRPPRLSQLDPFAPRQHQPDPRAVGAAMELSRKKLPSKSASRRKGGAARSTTSSLHSEGAVRKPPLFQIPSKLPTGGR